MRRKIILFVGDSLVEHFEVTDRLHYEGYQLVNIGYGGYTTSNLIENLPGIGWTRPEIIFLLIGTNDFCFIGDEPQAIFERIERIVEILRSEAPEAKIIVSSLLPVNEEMGRNFIEPRTNRSIDFINEQISKMKDIIYFNINPLLKGKDGMLVPEYTEEGLHITKKGYDVISEKLNEVLANLLKIK